MKEYIYVRFLIVLSILIVFATACEATSKTGFAPSVAEDATATTPVDAPAPVVAMPIKDMDYYNNKIVILGDQNQFYTADRQNDAWKYTDRWTTWELAIPAAGEWLDFEIDAASDTLFIHHLDTNGDNQLLTYDLATQTVLDTMELGDRSALSNIVFRAGYSRDLYYATVYKEQQYALIQKHQLGTQSTLDIVKIPLPQADAYVASFDVTPDIDYVLYTITAGHTQHTYVHHLPTNTTSAIEATSAYYLPRFVEEHIEGWSVQGIHTDTEPIIVTYARTDATPSVQIQIEYDTVIANGIVIDPETETMKFGYNVGVIGDRVEAITREPLAGKAVIDATHKIVSPGFIDMLSFNPNATTAKYKITDGVTTNLSMHGATVNYDAFFRAYQNATPVNYGGALFAVKLRQEQGLGSHGTPTAADIEKMKARAKEEIKKGAIGIAFSPEYYPGTTPEEIKAIMEAGKEYGVVTHFHARYSAIAGEKTGIDGVKEVIGYAKELDAPVHFMHLHSTGGTNMMDEALALINEARAEGYRITYDIYPYDSWISDINMARFAGDWQTRFGITYSDLQIGGKAGRLTKELFTEFKKTGGLVIAYAMKEQEIIRALQEDYAMIGSDATIDSETVSNHPRGAGTFSRFIGRYLRDLHIVPFMDGMKKLTINNAKHLEDVAPALQTRGRLQEGSTADITIFTYESILDTATGEKPASPSVGIDYVLVAGQIALDENGFHAQVRNGKPIKGIFP